MFLFFSWVEPFLVSLVRCVPLLGARWCRWVLLRLAWPVLLVGLGEDYQVL